MIEIVITAGAFVGGVVLTLYLMGKRPIHINISAHAEAHGGSSHVSTQAAPNSNGGMMSGFLSIIKVLALTAIAIFCLVMVGGLLSKINEPARITISAPTQEAPKIIIPQQAPPIINVQPSAASPLETIGLIIVGIVSIITIIISMKVFRALRIQRQIEEQHAYPVEYERTEYGFTPKKPVVQQDDLVSEFFKRR